MLCSSIDDSIEEKPYTDQSELICTHFDHAQNRYVKGINLLNRFFFCTSSRSRPSNRLELIKKTELVTIPNRQRRNGSVLIVQE